MELENSNRIEHFHMHCSCSYMIFLFLFFFAKNAAAFLGFAMQLAELLYFSLSLFFFVGKLLQLMKLQAQESTFKVRQNPNLESLISSGASSGYGSWLLI